MIPFTNNNAMTVKEARALLGKHNGNAALNAVGTGLIGAMKSEMLPGYPEVVIKDQGHSRL